jgi:hypothetical protein
MLDNDEQEFTQFVLSHTNIVLIAEFSPNRHPLVLPNLPCPPQRWWWAVAFWHRDYPFEPVRWVRKEVGSESGMYMFSGDELPIIKFNRCILRDSGELERGRIWTGSKDPTFLQWYDSIARWVRQRFNKVEKVGSHWHYAGPQAYAWYQTGGVLGRR